MTAMIFEPRDHIVLRYMADRDAHERRVEAVDGEKPVERGAERAGAHDEEGGEENRTHGRPAPSPAHGPRLSLSIGSCGGPSTMSMSNAPGASDFAQT